MCFAVAKPLPHAVCPSRESRCGGFETCGSKYLCSDRNYGLPIKSNHPALIYKLTHTHAGTHTHMPSQ